MDSVIIKKIKSLKRIQPDSSWLFSQRSFLLSEISQGNKPEVKKGISLVFPFFNAFKVFKPAFAIALVVIVLLSSLATMGVISAAQNSLPGDSLYPLKTAFEQTQLTFTPGEANKTKLSIKFATQRIDEFSQLIDNKPENKKDIEQTVKKFTAQIVSVQESIDKLKEKNAEKAAEIAKLVKAQASLYEETLIKTNEKLADILPGEKEELRENINQALVEVNKTKEMSDELIKEEEDKQILREETSQPSNEDERQVLVPGGEEQIIESPSTQFENLQNEIIPQEEKEAQGE